MSEGRDRKLGRRDFTKGVAGSLAGISALSDASRVEAQSEPSLEGHFRTFDSSIFKPDGLDVRGTLFGLREYLVWLTDDRGNSVVKQFRTDRNGETDEDDISLRGLTDGAIQASILSPGRDGEFGDGTFRLSEDVQDATGLPASLDATFNNFIAISRELSQADLTQSEVRNILIGELGLEDNLEEGDDLIVTEEFRLLDDSRTSIDDIVPRSLADNLTGVNPIEVGETMVIRGTTNRNPDDATIVVEAEEGPSTEEFGTDVADDWPADGEKDAQRSGGVWTTEFEITDEVEPGEYVIRADDGDRIDEETVEIVAEGTIGEGERTPDRTPDTIDGFEISISGTNSPVTEGDTLRINAIIENTGGQEGSQTVTAEVSDVGSDSKTVWLISDSSTVKTLTIPTENGDAGTHDVEIATEDDSTSLTVTVEEEVTGESGGGQEGDNSTSGGNSASEPNGEDGGSGQPESDGNGSGSEDTPSDDEGSGGGMGTTEMLLGGGAVGALVGAYVLKRRRDGKTKPEGDDVTDEGPETEAVSQSEKEEESEGRHEKDSEKATTTVATEQGGGAEEKQTETEKKADQHGEEQELEEKIQRIDGKIEEAEDALEAGKLSAALSHAEDAVEKAEKASNQAKDAEQAERVGDLLFGARDLRRRIQDKEESHEGAKIDEAEEAESEAESLEREQKQSPPETVPSAPDLSVKYDEISEKEPIGKGGNADVYKVTYDGETLALKEPRVQGTLHKETAERFVTEAETWDRLDDHENIVSVVDYGSEPLPWIALEYMDGGELGERADASLDEKLWTAVQVCEGVIHAHRRGVAHLDLKPENVLFRQTDDDVYDVPKVADWGLAKMLLEHSKSIEGLSPQYAAPEQFDSEAYGSPDHETDVYQLGAVFYELFTGRPPFEGGHLEVMDSIKNENPRPPSEINPDLPEELDEILLTCLSKDREERYESVLYLRDELKGLRNSR